MTQVRTGTGIRVASIFSGAGGMDLGFNYAGFDIVYASEIEEVCCETLSLNVGILRWIAHWRVRRRRL